MEQTFGSGHVELTRFTKGLKLGSHHDGLGDYYGRTLVTVVTGVKALSLPRRGGGGGGRTYSGYKAPLILSSVRRKLSRA